MEATTNAQDRVSLRTENARPASNKLIAVGALLLAATLIGGWSNPRQLGHSWLFSFSYFYTICCGLLFWTILHHATNAGWSVLVRRQMENVASLFAGWIPLLFIPLLPCLLGKSMYAWMTPANVAHDALFQAKQAYLNLDFYYIRIFIYFGFFALASWGFRRLSMTQDSDGNPAHTLRMQKFGYGSIAAFAVCITFSAFDWLMGLQHNWYSTMWGVYIFAGSVGAGMALLALIMHALKGNGYLPAVTEEHFHIIGKLMFAFTVFWSYIAFSQFMLIWYANIPEETIFFKVRNTGSWFWVSMALVLGHFLIPFLLLITQAAKKTPKRLIFAACWMLMIHAVDHYWISMPVLHGEGVSISWTDLTAWLGMAALLSGAVLRRIMSANLYPLKDPRLSESWNLKN